MAKLNTSPNTGLLLVLIILPVLATTASLSFSFLPSLIAAGGLILFYASRKRLPSFPRAPTRVFGLFTLWAALSLLWSIDAGLGVQALISVAVIFLSGLALFALIDEARPVLRKRTAAALLIAVAAAVLYLGVELAVWDSTGGFILSGLNERRLAYLNRSVTSVGLFLWPAVAVFMLSPAGGALKPYRWLVPVFFLIYFAFASLSASLTASAGLIIGSVVFGLAWYMPRLTYQVLRILIVAGILTAPLLATYVLPSETLKPVVSELPRSSKSRICIWHYTAERIFEKPVLGWGFRNSRKVPGAAQADFSHLPACRYPDVRDVLKKNPAKILPLHPHNGVLQIWLETGAVGAAILIALMLVLFRSISQLQQGPRAQAIALALLSHGLFAAMIAYGLWQNWWVGAFWLIAALFTLCATPHHKKRP